MDVDNHKSSALVFMLLAMATIPIADAVAKHLTANYPLLQIAWVRFAVHAGCLVPLVAWRYGRRALWPKQMLLQVTRGGFLFTDVVLFFGALAVLPLADTLALFFVAPLIVTVLSVPMLGERVGLRRWLAVTFGFLGALVIIRPGVGVFQLASLMAVGAAVAYALFLIFTKKLSGDDPPMVTVTHTALFSAVAIGLAMPFVWVMPDWAGAGWMLAMGLLAVLSHYFLVLAFERASASYLAPLTYSEMIVAVAVGYFAFGDFPDLWTWVGMAIIAVSGIYVAGREKKNSE